MRMMLAFVAVIYSAAAFAQAASAPAAADKPPAAEKPVKEAKSHSAPAGRQSVAVRLQSCLDIEDGTKDRLNCYDAVLPPAPKPKGAAAKTVMECRFTKEEDERLGCYNGFVESMPLLPKS